MISLLTFPLMAGTASVAPLLVPVVLGAKWHDAIPLLIVLGPAGALRSITANGGSLMLSQGRSRATFLSSAAFALVVVAGFVVGVRWGLVGLCIAYTLVVVAVTPPLCWVAFRDLDLRVRDYFRALAPLAAITLVMVAAVVASGVALPHTLPVTARLAAQVLVGVVVYVGLLVRLRPAAYVDALTALRSRRAGSEEQAAVAYGAG